MSSIQPLQPQDGSSYVSKTHPNEQAFINANDNASFKRKTITDSTSADTTTAAVYEKSNMEKLSAATYTADMEKVKQMKEETDRHMLNLFKETVTESALKQFGNIKNIFARLAQGEEVNGVKATDEDIAQAKADVAEGGYWSAEATSDRFLDFAKALSGGDKSKADLLLDAFKEGYKAATEAWGDELPDISKQTYDLTLKKFEDWKNGTESSTEAIAQA